MNIAAASLIELRGAVRVAVHRMVVVQCANLFAALLALRRARVGDVRRGFGRGGVVRFAAFVLIASPFHGATHIEPQVDDAIDDLTQVDHGAEARHWLDCIHEHGLCNRVERHCRRHLWDDTAAATGPTEIKIDVHVLRDRASPEGASDHLLKTLTNHRWQNCASDHPGGRCDAPECHDLYVCVCVCMCVCVSANCDELAYI